MTEDLLTTFNINLVVRGTVSETAAEPFDTGADAHRYAIPRAKGVFRRASLLPMSAAHTCLTLHLFGSLMTSAVWHATSC